MPILTIVPVQIFHGEIFKYVFIYKIRPIPLGQIVFY